MSGLIGKKIGMTSIFSADGKNTPCTVLECKPNIVTEVKTLERDGYEALQLGYEDIKEKHLAKPQIESFKKNKVTPKRKLVEFRYFPELLKLGEEINVELFQEGDYVDVIGTSKGKGFQGVVKRHGFAGVGQATHGQHNRLRAPGSIGAASYPSRVFPGTRMAGRMGGDRVKIQNLKVLKVDTDKNLIIVNGAVPGAKNSYILIEK